MNINSPPLLSLFSSAEGLDKLSQTLQLAGDGTQAFSNALLEKINQLKSISGQAHLTGELTTLSTLGNSTEQGIADFLDGKAAIDDFSGFLGNSLPTDELSVKSIDLEQTLEILSTVLNTVEDELSEELSIAIHINQVADEIQKLKAIILNDGTTESAYLENQLELLSLEVESLKTSFSADSIEPQQAAIPIQLVDGTISRDLKGEATNEAKQYTAMAPTLEEEESLALERAFPEKKSEETKLRVFQQQNIGQSEGTLVDNPVKSTGIDLDIFFQHEKNSQQLAELESADILTDLVGDKDIPKIVSNMALLNRVLLSENRSEIPAMTKHFVQPEWNQEFAEKVLWMHKKEIPSAELKLNPKHLGPVLIKVDVSQDQATVSFIAQHAAVKEAIEAAMPKLREMFSAQQINLVEVNVSQQESGDRQSREFNQMGNNQAQENGQDAHDPGRTDNTELVEEIEAGRAIASNGILSLFA